MGEIEIICPESYRQLAMRSRQGGPDTECLSALPTLSPSPVPMSGLCCSALGYPSHGERVLWDLSPVRDPDLLQAWDLFCLSHSPLCQPLPQPPSLPVGPLTCPGPCISLCSACRRGAVWGWTAIPFAASQRNGGCPRLREGSPNPCPGPSGGGDWPKLSVSSVAELAFLAVSVSPSPSRWTHPCDHLGCCPLV